MRAHFLTQARRALGNARRGAAADSVPGAVGAELCAAGQAGATAQPDEHHDQRPL